MIRRMSLWPVALLWCYLCVASAHAFTSRGFIENVGQLDGPAVFYSRDSETSIFFTPEGVVLDLRVITSSDEASPDKERGCAVYIQFEEPSVRTRIEGQSPLPTLYHFFKGKDSSCWHTNVLSYEQVVYRDIWTGVDLVFQLRPGELRYELVQTEEGTTPQFRVNYIGGEQVMLGPDGETVISTSAVTLTAYMDVEAAKGAFRWSETDPEHVSGQYHSLGAGNPDVLLWSTFIGGGAEDIGMGLILDGLDNPIVSGYTRSSDFPTTPGSYDRYRDGDYDVFVSKISSSGNELIWSTFIGGAGSDVGKEVAFAPDGNLVITGHTGSEEFPVTPEAYDISYNGLGDIFIMKMAPSCDEIIWSTLLGGSDGDKLWGHPLAIDSDGSPVVAGRTKSSDFPTTPGAYDRTHNGGFDILVAKLSPCGSFLLWSTLLGGVNNEGESHGYGSGIALDIEGNPIITGGTQSPDFPSTPGAFDEIHNGGYDAFVTKLSSLGDTLCWSTFFGDTGEEVGYCVDIDASQNVVFCGWTGSAGFPVTPGAFDDVHNGGLDAYIAKLSPDGGDLLWSSFFGGGDDEQGITVLLDASGRPHMAGLTLSPDFPTTPGAFSESSAGNNDAFFTKVSQSGADLLWSTFIGGSEADAAWGIDLDSIGNPFVAGYTPSSDFPVTSDAYDVWQDGERDVFALHLDIGSVASMPLPVDDPIAPHSLKCAPNPFNRTARIDFEILSGAQVSMIIYNCQGRCVRALCKRRFSSGQHTVTWDGLDDSGEPVAGGIYFCELRTPQSVVRRKITLVR